MNFETTGLPSIRPTIPEQAFAWFLRLVALYCLALGVLYWVRLIGVYDGPMWRFDLMPLHWQLAVAALASLFPFAASGLWMQASWGPVIWAACVVTETAMYMTYSDLYGRRLAIVVIHLTIALIYCIFRAVIWWQRRQARIRADMALQGSEKIA